MKLKSLFLASLAAIAMASCSNEVEGVDNGINNVEKNAKLQFSIGFAGATTRANTEQGSALEDKVNTVNIRVSYSEGTADDVFHFVFPGDFEKVNNVYSLIPSKLMEVAPSAGATLYVTVNGDASVTLNGTETAIYDDTEASIRTGVAEDNNFLMSGSSASTPIVANSSTNKATVEVNRVAARIDEITVNKTDEFTFVTEYRDLSGDVYETTTTSMTAEVLGYALCNLNKNTNIFYSETFATPDYFKPFVADNNNLVSYSNFVDKAIGTTKTYCLENKLESNVTSVIYKVQYKYGNEPEATGSFFTYKKDGKTVLYKDFDSLDKDNGYRFSLSFRLTAESTYDEFIVAGVTKYEAGIAYYTRPITTGTANSEMIARNNCYKLNVANITGLGKAVIDPKVPGDPTLLNLEITVMNWTINPNDFTLN